MVSRTSLTDEWKTTSKIRTTEPKNKQQWKGNSTDGFLQKGGLGLWGQRGDPEAGQALAGGGGRTRSGCLSWAARFTLLLLPWRKKKRKKKAYFNLEGGYKFRLTVQNQRWVRVAPDVNGLMGLDTMLFSLVLNLSTLCRSSDLDSSWLVLFRACFCFSYACRATEGTFTQELLRMFLSTCLNVGTILSSCDWTLVRYGRFYGNRLGVDNMSSTTLKFFLLMKNILCSYAAMGISYWRTNWPHYSTTLHFWIIRCNFSF